MALDFNFAAGTYSEAGTSYGSLTAVPGVSYTGGPGTNTTSAGLVVKFASNVPRITDRGILIEPSATNYLTDSEYFYGNWSSANGGGSPAPSVSSFSGTDPTGATSTINTISFPASSSGQFSFVYQLPGNTSLGPYGASIFVRGNSGTSGTIYLLLEDTNAAPSPGNYLSAAINFTGSWQRFNLTGSFSTLSGSVGYVIGYDGRGGATGAGATVDVWGAQLETGSVVTSYIPTSTGATVTRAADQLTATFTGGSTQSVDYGTASNYTGAVTSPLDLGVTSAKPWVGGQVRRAQVQSSGSVGTAAGTSTATATSQSLSPAAGAAGGSSTATATGKALDNAVGTSAGTSTATGTAVSTKAAAGSSAGASTAAGVGRATDASTGTAAGTSTASAPGIAWTAATGSSAGTSTATATANVAGQSTGIASGTSTATATGRANDAAVGSSAGVSTAMATAQANATGVGIAAGSSTAMGAVAGASTGAGTAAGASTASGVSIPVSPAVGTATGTSTATGASSAATPSAGVAAGTSTASATSQISVAGLGLSYGFGYANGQSSVRVSATGSASGASTANATSPGLFTYATGTAAGSSIAAGVGAYAQFPGYMCAAPPYPSDDDALIRFLQSVVAGVTCMDGSLVRPRWQNPDPGRPQRDVTWCGIGITTRLAEGLPAIVHAADGDGSDTLLRYERLTLMCSFYGPLSEQTAAYLRDGLFIAQNREVLRAAGFALVNTSDFTHAPELVNDGWLSRTDLTVTLRREIRRSYPVLSLLSASGTLLAQGSASVLVRQINAQGS